MGDKRNETFEAGSYYYQMTAKRPLKSLMIMEDLKNERLNGIGRNWLIRTMYQRITVSNDSGLTTWYKGKTLEEWALTAPKYTDPATGLFMVCYRRQAVYAGKTPKSSGKCARRRGVSCEKFAEMTGMIQYLDDNTVAYVGDNFASQSSQRTEELEIDTHP